MQPQTIIEPPGVTGVEFYKPPSFRQFVDIAYPGYRWMPHLELVAGELQAVADGVMPHTQVLVNMPPNFGKSLAIAQLFPAYFLRRHPERKVFVCSHSSSLIFEHSRRAREFYVNTGGALLKGASGVRQWKTMRGGGLFVVATEGRPLGFHYDLLVVDDPFGAEVESQSMPKQKKILQWWDQLNRRQMGAWNPGNKVYRILVHQRTAKGDLAGRVLDRERQRARGMRVIFIPALQPESDKDHPVWPKSAEVLTLDDVAPGESLAPDYKTTKELKELREDDPLAFSALYQQDPKVGGAGDYFAEEDIRQWPFPDAPTMMLTREIRSWDLGYSETGDWTVGARIARYDLGKDPDSEWLRTNSERVIARTQHCLLVVKDVILKRVPPNQLEDLIYETMLEDGPDVEVSLPRDPAAGTVYTDDLIMELQRRMSEEHMWAPYIHPMDPTKGKLARSRTLRRLARRGAFFIMPGPWQAEFIDQLTNFTGGDQPNNDDCVDASADAGEILVQNIDLVW